MRLKNAQIEKLRGTALDKRRRLVDRMWAATQLSNSGIEIGPNIIPGYATPTEGRLALLAAEGGCVTVDQARALYRRKTLISQIRLSNVIAYSDPDGRVLVPVWQFRPEGGLIYGLPRVLKALRKGSRDQMTAFTFLLQQEPMLEMRTPLESLRCGEVGRVLEAAIAHARGP